MKVCIVGAGAIGGFIGTRLAASGLAQVGAIARGATLQALKEHGWRLKQGDTLIQAPAAAVASDAHEIGVQDLVIIAVKGPALASVAAGIGPLLGPGTIVLPAMNGVPWWFGQGLDSLGAAPLESVDPGGRISAAIPGASVIGCVVHAGTSVAEPGLVQHGMGQTLVIGEPDGGQTQRLRALRDLLGAAGFDVTLSSNIRYDIWFKLWGNLTVNPVSAITGATIDRLLDDALVREFCCAAMREAAAIGEAIGFHVTHSAEDRQEVTRKLGAFKTSMLQDVEAGRQIELDSIVAAVHEIGRRVAVPTPNIDAILGLTRLFGRVHGLYPNGPSN
jgi:2-dehydropantoate 2-reductase